MAEYGSKYLFIAYIKVHPFHFTAFDIKNFLVWKIMKRNFSILN